MIHVPGRNQPGRGMTDDLESRMRRACTLGAAIKLLDEGADEIVRLRARVRELEADRDSWAQQADDRVKDWDDMRQRAERAESERDALRADAERYRWLRVQEVRVYQNRDPYGCMLAASENALDGMIDKRIAALAAGGKT